MLVQCKDCDAEYERPPAKRCPGCGSFLYGPAESDEERGFRDGYHAWPPVPPLHPGRARDYCRGYDNGTTHRARACLDALPTKEGA